MRNCGVNCGQFCCQDIKQFSEDMKCCYSVYECVYASGVQVLFLMNVAFDIILRDTAVGGTVRSCCVHL